MKIFSKKDCLNCETLKKTLNKQNIKYESELVYSAFDIVKKFPDLEDQLVEVSHFPITIEDEKVIAYEEMMNRYWIPNDSIIEPILDPASKRYSILPVQYHSIYEMYLKARRSYWQPEEIDWSKDEADWITLSTEEKYFISMILSFFATSDGIVNENLSMNFKEEVTIPEARAFYSFQEAIEEVHNETYGLALDKYIKNPTEKAHLLDGIKQIPAVKKKAEWAFKWMSDERSFHERIIAFSCVEGIFFSGSFCAIFWLKKRGLLPGLSFSNELISRDEGLHTDFAVLLYQHLQNKVPESKVHSIIREAVQFEQEFIIESLPCKLIGMNAGLMNNYIEFVADRLLGCLGYNKIYQSSNPFDFMENISLEGKTNFFEKRVGEYSKVHNSEENMFALDEEF